MDYVAQSEKEYQAGGEFDDLPENITEPCERRIIAARGLVQRMQEAGVLPDSMSDGRFSQVAQWIAAGMQAAVEDTQPDPEFVTVQIPPVNAWGSSTHAYAIDGYEIGSKHTNRLATISRLSMEAPVNAWGTIPRELISEAFNTAAWSKFGEDIASGSEASNSTPKAKGPAPRSRRSDEARR